MKPAETKTEFIRLRAEGRSFSFIGSKLKISKDTCHRWEKELQESISELKREQLEELYTEYQMTKEARIRRLGKTLGNIDDALSQMDMRAVPPEKLLDFKLKYAEALKNEYMAPVEPLRVEKSSDIVSALSELLKRVQRGEVTTEQAQRESSVLLKLMNAYETAEVKDKLDALASVLDIRDDEEY